MLNKSRESMFSMLTHTTHLFKGMHKSASAYTNTRNTYTWDSIVIIKWNGIKNE